MLFIASFSSFLCPSPMGRRTLIQKSTDYKHIINGE